jgi:hypothetical protein
MVLSNEAASPTVELRRQGSGSTITKVAKVKDFGGTAWDNPGPKRANYAGTPS